jgi:hypothetical protein
MALTTQQKLDQAETARHNILTGQNAVTVSSTSGKSVTFDKTNLAALDAYIVSLRRELGLPTGVSGPIVPSFGGGDSRRRRFW